MNSDLLLSFFCDEPAGLFEQGQILSRKSAANFDQTALPVDAGMWQCSFREEDELQWSDQVYAIFGFDRGTRVSRDQALKCYSSRSRDLLEHVRAFAISRKLGFLLDAEISPPQRESVAMRILAVPVLEGNRIVGIRGAKRLL